MWFAVYLASLVVREQILIAIAHRHPWEVGLYVLALVPDFLFWMLTPLLLVRDGPRSRRLLAKAGLAGMLIDTLTR